MAKTKPVQQEGGGAAKTTGRFEGGAIPASHRQGDRQRRVQALQNTSCQQIHRPCPHRH
ncbi:hypothetical protein LEMLEM_LOCUS24819 [Lemmus lemmus]